MTDPNIPPRDDRPHTTIVNNDSGRTSGGGAGLAFAIGAIVVVLAVIVWFLLAGRTSENADRDIDVNVDLPTVTLPEPPANPMPEIPSPAPAEPPAG